MTDLRLVIFEVDGTIVDSQGDIIAAMAHAFAEEDLVAPPREEILRIIGLSLPVAIGRLAPAANAAQLDRMVKTYKNAYVGLRARGDARLASPLYPGARAVLDRLAAEPATLLAVATGKSRRGLDALLASHGLHGLFHSLQVADHHPSKPHPSMILAALSETGVAPERAVMVGDTTYDMEMARAAGIRAVGVSWGYHAAHLLRADICIDRWSALPEALDQLLEPA